MRHILKHSMQKTYIRKQQNNSVVELLRLRIGRQLWRSFTPTFLLKAGSPPNMCSGHCPVGISAAPKMEATEPMGKEQKISYTWHIVFVVTRVCARALSSVLTDCSVATQIVLEARAEQLHSLICSKWLKSALKIFLWLLNDLRTRLHCIQRGEGEML